MQARSLLSLSMFSFLLGCQPAPAPKMASEPAVDLLAHGEFLIKTGGCNDCHTPDYGPAEGKVPKSKWLTGSNLGFMGPWGTTYPSNLRLSLAKMSEDEWVTYSSTFHTRPPMPDFTVRDMAEADRRALHRFITSLGPAGTEAPAYLPPGQLPLPPYFQLVLPPTPDGAEAPRPPAPAGAPAS